MFMYVPYKEAPMRIKEFQQINANQFNLKVRQFLSHNSSFSIEQIIKVIQTAKQNSTKVIRKRVREDAFEWITLEVLDGMKKRDKIYKKVKKWPLNTIYLEQYQIICDYVKCKVSETKDKKLKTEIERAGSNPRQVCNIINKVFLKKRSKGTSLEYLNVNGQFFKEKRRWQMHTIMFSLT